MAKGLQVYSIIGKGMALSFLFSFLFVACNPSDRMGVTGTLRLTSLSADTVALHRGTDSQVTRASYEDEFEHFMQVEDYHVRIAKGEDDTVFSYERYADMPQVIELPEGAYTLTAYKGINASASFETPYFEGSQEFSIRGDMNTSLGVTCTLANTRLTVESTKEFDEVYEDYTVEFSTEYIHMADSTLDGFPVKKGETRPLYLQTAKEGTDLNMKVFLQKPEQKDTTVFQVSDPLKIKRRQNVRMILNLKESGDGMRIDVILDDSLAVEAWTVSIPGYMSGEYGKPKLTWVASNKQLTYELSAGIQSLQIEYHPIDNEYQKTVYELTDETDVKRAVSDGLTWTNNEGLPGDVALVKPEGEDLAKTPKSGDIDFTGLLERLEEGEYEFIVTGVDAVGNKGKASFKYNTESGNEV